MVELADGALLWTESEVTAGMPGAVFVHGGPGLWLGELPSFLGIALVPGLVAMVLYYRALRSTPASISSFAELGYPAALFLIYSLPAPVGFGSPLKALEVVGAVVLVAAVTSLNVLKGREGVTVALG